MAPAVICGLSVSDAPLVHAVASFGTKLIEAYTVSSLTREDLHRVTIRSNITSAHESTHIVSVRPHPKSFSDFKFPVHSFQ